MLKIELIVAPYAGAWIETYNLLSNGVSGEVAPYAGAWIETKEAGTSYFEHDVAPYAGAWIETIGSSNI